MLNQLLDMLEKSGVNVTVIDLSESRSCRHVDKVMKCLDEIERAEHLSQLIGNMYRKNGRPETADRIKEWFAAKTAPADALLMELKPDTDHHAGHEILDRFSASMAFVLPEISASLSEIVKRQAAAVISVPLDDLLT